MARTASGIEVLEQTKAIGVSVGWACQLRRRLIRQGGKAEANRARPGGRRRENMTREAEAKFLEPFFEKAKAGGILVVGEIKRALDKCLGRQIASASAYNLLHRHGWRKLAPYKRHPQADAAVREDWEKNSPTPLAKSSARGRAEPAPMMTKSYASSGAFVLTG